MRTIDPDSFRDDDRAVETLPIRLVIALVVGVAALAFMMNMINGLTPQTQSELSVESSRTVVNDGSGGSITFTVRDSNGEAIPDAKILIEGGTAKYDDGEPVVSGSRTTEDGTTTISASDINKNIDWKSEQDRGTLRVQVIPPGDGSSYKDDKENIELILVQESSNTA